MSKLRFALLAAAFCATALLPVVSKADTLSYNFTYVGNPTYGGGDTASGSGSITFTFSSLGSGGLADITAFQFTDTLTNISSQTSTYTYGLSDLASAAENFGGTLANPTLANVSLSTKYVAGTPSSFGAVDFVLNYSPTIFDSTSTTSSNYGLITSGGGTFTLAPTVAATPEPSSLVLLGTGLAGSAFLLARRRSAAGSLL